MKKLLILGVLLAISPSVAFAFKNTDSPQNLILSSKIEHMPLLADDTPISTLPSLLEHSSHKTSALILQRLQS